MFPRLAPGFSVLRLGAALRMSTVLRHGATLMLAMTASGAEVVLRDGRVIAGEVVSADDVAIVLRQTTGGMTADLHLRPGEIAHISPGVAQSSATAGGLARRRTALLRNGDAEDWWALAQACRAAGEALSARSAAQEVITRDRHHEAARRFLGFSMVRGVWMRPQEAAVAEGRVWYDGRWVTWAECQQAEAQAEARRLTAAEARAALAERRSARMVASPAATWPMPATSIMYASTTYVPRMVYWPAYGAGAPGLPLHLGTFSGGGLSLGGSGSSGSWGLRWHW